MNNETKELEKRIKELENILCPNGHDFKESKSKINEYEVYSPGSMFIVTHYYCTRCNKHKRTLYKEEMKVL